MSDDKQETAQDGRRGARASEQRGTTMKPEPDDPLVPSAEQAHVERNDRETSPSGGVRGKPAAEHGAYGMVRKDSAAAVGASEGQIRGTEPAP
jgi:hypothetical protein